jgi:hypothetical protein
MYKTFLIVILSLVLSSVFSQEMNSKVIKIYSGPFKSDKPYDLNMIGQQKIGKAEYEYYERPDETRVFNGFFNLSYYNTLFISGSFVEDMKNGEWKIVSVSKENSIVTKWTLTGRFILGKLEGEWRDITEKTTNGKTIKIEECIAHFHNNNFIGKFEYNSKQLSINGNISNAGFLDSTWIVNRIENGFSYKTTLKFKKGVQNKRNNKHKIKTKNMFNYSKDNDNIVTITMDMQGRSANVINEEFGKLWLETLNRLEAEKADIAGVVLTSAKSTFFAGADIDNLYQTNQSTGNIRYVRRLEKTIASPRNTRKTCCCSIKRRGIRWWFRDCFGLPLSRCTQQSKSSFRFARSWLRFIAWRWRHHSFNQNDWLATSTSLLNRRQKIKSKRSSFSRYHQ